MIKQIAEKNELEIDKPIIDLNRKVIIGYCKAGNFKVNFDKLKQSLLMSSFSK